MRFHGEAMATVDDQVRRLNEQDAAPVLCDAPAVPLVAARRAGVPGFLMSNFTWADIYAPYARTVGGDALRFVADLRSCYRQATATFRVEPAMSMSWLSPKIDPGMVVNQGRDRSGELRRLFRLAQDRQASVHLHWTLRAKRSRLVATAAVRGPENPFPGLSPRATGKARQFPSRTFGRLARR